MAEPFKSVLLVDFDSLHRSLTAAGGEAAARFSLKVPGWIGGLESGRLIGPQARTFALKRCYSDPKAIGESRANFANTGFDLVEVAAASGSVPRGVDMMMAMDAIERLADDGDETIDEVVILSAEPTFAPLLTRLRGHGRRTAIYTDTHTAQIYRGLADAVLDIAAFAEFLLIHDAAESASALSVERTEIEAFARRIHAATSIPLFSPRTFAELFRLLTEEIVANGYHFQTTAKNVADRLSEAGRSVTRRQVVFIVKGLALKGHVFSTTDTPRKLAEVFREQARYLIENAGVKLDEAQERILSAWLVDRAPTSLARPAPPAPAPSAPVPPQPSPSVRPAVAEAAAPPAKPMPQPAGKIETLRPMPMLKPAERAAEKPAAMQRPAAPARDAPAETVPARAEPRPSPPMISPEDARAAIAAKIAQSVRPKPSRPAAKSAAALAPLAPPPPPRTPVAREATDEAEAAPQSIESSILAAIAEAVDVLVEDNEPPKAKKPVPASPPALRKRAAVPAVAGARPQIESRPAPEAPAPAEPRRQDGEDIGDEIQRIIATYNRNRKDEPEA